MHIWGLHLWASLRDIAIRIWSFGGGFACATAVGCAGLKLSFGIIILLKFSTIIK